MNKEDKQFIEGYEKLLNKGYCDCNEMNCIDNNSPRRILNIVKQLQQENKELHNKIDKANATIDTNLELIEYLGNKIDKAIELNGEIDKSLRMKNTSAYIELEDMIFEQWKMLKKDSDVDE